MNANFKAGDKVRLVEVTFLDVGMGYYQGNIVEIVYPDGDGYRVRRDSNAYHDCYMFDYQLEEVRPTLQFKVGDLVCVTETDEIDAENGVNIGDVGEVVRVDANDLLPYQVIFDCAHRSQWLRSDQVARPTLEPTPPALQFKVGDRVLIKATIRDVLTAIAVFCIALTLTATGATLIAKGLCYLLFGP